MEEKPSVYNVGLSILRIWMCFEVILVHCWNQEGTKYVVFSLFALYEGIATCVFMLMSFLLTDISELAVHKSRRRARFYRLLIPQFFWTIVYGGGYKILSLKFNLGIEINYKTIIFQMVFGSPLNETMWYQIDLIILTGIFLILFKSLNKKYAVICVYCLCMLALLLQYSGVVVRLFENLKYLKYYLRYTGGRLYEMLPYASLGILFCQYNILQHIKKNRSCVIIVSSIAIYLITNYSVFVNPVGYDYQGLYNIFITVLLISLFCAIPFNRLPNKFCEIINNISKYTMGVYCMHRFIAMVLNTCIVSKKGMQINSFSECFIIFIVCLLLSFWFSRTSIKWIRSVFM